MPKTTVWRMQIAFCVTNATNTHSVYVLFIFLQLQKMVAQTCLSVKLYEYCLCDDV